MTEERDVIHAVIHKHGEIYVIDPIKARAGDIVTWKAPTDLVILFPEEPEAGIFLDSQGRGVQRLKIPQDNEGSVQVVKEYPAESSMPKSRQIAADDGKEYEGELEQEFPYVIYWRDWEDSHSAFFVGGSHPKMFVRWAG